GPIVEFDVRDSADETLANSELLGLERRRPCPGLVGLSAVQPEMQAGLVPNSDDLVPLSRFRHSHLNARFWVAVEEDEEREPSSLRRVIQTEEIAARKLEDVLVSVGLLVGRANQGLNGYGSF